MKKYTTIQITTELRDAIKVEAKKQHRTTAALIHKVMETYLANQNNKPKMGDNILRVKNNN